ncbi:MAG TPA: glycosyltransferase family 9 protein [Longimicrobiales bacterium]|nr:glycosyltransferase family 9 protein [Longimicrobiales bacterium]
MRRYAGEDLGPTPRIAVLGSSKLGNFIVTTPLLRGLKERFPEAVVDFYGSPVNRAFEAACPWIDWRTDIFPATPGRLGGIAAAVEARVGGDGYDLVVNCDGFNPWTTALAPLLSPRFVVGNALGPGLSDRLPTGDHPWQRILDEPDWTTPDFLQRYEGWLDSNYIGELFCRMAFVETDYTNVRLESVEPPFEVPDVLIHANATREAKLWPTEPWSAVLDWCGTTGLTVGLTGTSPKPGNEDDPGIRIEAALAAHPAVEDLRGRTSPIELAGAFRRARACVSVDSGPLHVAAAVGCPTVAIFGNDADAVGASPLLLWMPRGPHVRRTVSEAHCGECLARRFKNDACVLSEHLCMDGVTAGQVIGLLQEALAAR